MDLTLLILPASLSFNYYLLSTYCVLNEVHTAVNKTDDKRGNKFLISGRKNAA